MSDEVRPHGAERGHGADTRRQAQRVALELFTTYGYQATSLRQIADAIGINKASLYYHFPSKQAILESLFEDRGSEVQQLIEWLRVQPKSADLLESAVLRWVGSFSTDKLRGIRFLGANPLIARAVDQAADDAIGTNLNRFANELATLLPSSRPEAEVLLRMSILSINAAVEAAAGTDIADEHIVTAANVAARALIRSVLTFES
jgi:AcrR family transcriptional regulator